MYEATKGMLKMLELQHEEFTNRLRTENKTLVFKQKIEVIMLEMGTEDIRSTCGKQYIF
jgi:hypothetical protein